MALQKPPKSKRGPPKGVSGNPLGRPKGIKDCRTIRKENISKLMGDKKSITPLEFFQNVLDADDMPMNYKVDAAKNMMPYVHRKMPVAVEMLGGGEDPKPIKVVIDFKDARKKGA